MPSQFKESREVCYDARDKFWKCLDVNNDQAENCVKLRKEFEKSCSKQWVLHFDRKRKYEKYKETADRQNWEAPTSEKAKY